MSMKIIEYIHKLFIYAIVYDSNNIISVKKSN